MCAAQYMMEVDVSLRTNIDYLFTMRENILINRQKLYKYFFGQFAKFDDFDKVMTLCTQNYRALALDGTVSSTVPTDSVLWYKAAMEIPQFRLCKSVFWGMSKRYELSTNEVRRAQVMQFEIEHATTEAMGKRPGILLVQAEDEEGNVIT